jgi:transposase
LIRVFLGNARYHRTKLMQDWLGQPGRRIRLPYIPAYCPHLNPVERLWGAMHTHVTHNKCYESSRELAGEVLTFLREKGPANVGAAATP